MPGLEWNDLRFFLAVCEAGSVSAASRALSVDKATVVRHVDRLERRLGVRLLLRKASGWRPTAIGRRAAAAARAMHGAAETFSAELHDVRGAPRTPVSFTAPHWFCAELLAPVLPTLREQAPWLDLQLAATSRMLDLPQRVADLALRNSKPAQGDFVARRAGELGSALYAAKGYAKRHPRASAEDWSRHALVGYLDHMSYVPGFRYLDEVAGLARSVTRADDASVLRAAIRAGQGIGVLPCVLGDADSSLVRFSPSSDRGAARGSARAARPSAG